MTTHPIPALTVAGTVRNGLAWLAASLLSGLTIIVGFAIVGGIEAGRLDPLDDEFLSALVPGSLFIGLYVALFTALPTIALTWLRRAAGWYGLPAHLLMGALTGAATIQIFGFPLQHGVEGLPMTGFFAATGLVGGAVYWKFSVRR